MDSPYTLQSLQEYHTSQTKFLVSHSVIKQVKDIRLMDILTIQSLNFTSFSIQSEQIICKYPAVVKVPHKVKNQKNTKKTQKTLIFA